MTPADVGPVIGGLVCATAGGIFVVIGLLLRSAGEGELRRMLALHDLPATPVARAQDGERVRIEGRVVPVGAPLRSPLTNRDAVTCVVIAAAGGSRGKSLHEIAKDRCDFFIEDGAGERVRVSPKGATTMVTPDWLTGNLHVRGAIGINLLGRLSREQEDWVCSRLGSQQPLAYVEERLIGPGQPLSVIGRVRRDTGEPRMHADLDELTLLATSRAEAIGRLGRRRIAFLVFLIIGLLGMVGGLAWVLPALLR